MAFVAGYTTFLEPWKEELIDAWFGYCRRVYNETNDALLKAYRKLPVYKLDKRICEIEPEILRIKNN